MQFELSLGLISWLFLLKYKTLTLKHYNCTKQGGEEASSEQINFQVDPK